MSFNQISLSKTILAKLFATENISIVHRVQNTASFDLESRTVYLPVWENITEPLYDLLVSHETGHALHTPFEGYHTTAQKYKGVMRSYINITEDARIEKLQLRRYPGLRIAYELGYKDLFQRGLFEILPTEDLSKRALIDRINLQFKLGRWGIVNVPFLNKLEKELLEKVSIADTFEEAEQAAYLVYAYDKAHYKQQQEQQPQKQMMAVPMPMPAPSDEESEETEEPLEGEGTAEAPESDDSEEDSGTNDGKGEESDEEADAAGASKEGEEEEKEKADSAAEGEGEESEEEGEEESDSDAETDKPGTGGDNGDGYGRNLEGALEDAKTVSDEEFEKSNPAASDESFYKNLESLASGSKNASVLMLNMEAVDQKKFVVDWSKVIEPLLATKLDALSNYNKFRTETMAAVNHLIREFEMRKAADEHKRTLTAKTGELNYNRLAEYKFKDDLFKRSDIVHEGKNHGMFMVLDMSGSMSRALFDTVYQLLILAEFCMRNNLPFEVYGFSDSGAAFAKFFPERASFAYQPVKLDPMTVHVDWRSGFSMLNLLSNRMGAANYRKMAGYLLAWAASNSYGHKKAKVFLEDRRAFPDEAFSHLRLNGTPLVEAMYVSPAMVRDFKARTGVQVCHYVVLTDGIGGNIDSYASGQCIENIFNKELRKLFVFDKATKRTYEWNFTEKQAASFYAYSGNTSKAIYSVTMNMLTKRLVEEGCNVININLCAYDSVINEQTAASYGLDHALSTVLARNLQAKMWFEDGSYQTVASSNSRFYRGRGGSQKRENAAMKRVDADFFADAKEQGKKNGFVKLDSMIYSYEFVMFFNPPEEAESKLTGEALKGMKAKEIAKRLVEELTITQNSRMLAVEFSKLITA